MIAQNLEIFETKNFQYLMMPKTGCVSVINFLGEKNLHWRFITKPENKFMFTTIRNPEDRFFSGLVYDLQMLAAQKNFNINDVKIIDIINEDNIKDFFLKKVETLDKGKKMIHMVSQSTYLINVKIDCYVDTKDLTDFFKIHDSNIGKTNQVENENLKDVFKNQLEKETTLKKLIYAYLDFDNYVYNNILKSDKLWSKKMGPICFKEYFEF
jgi:hypothetical protein